MVPSRRHALAGVLIFVCLLAGCAKKPNGFAQRFIRPGEPKIDFGSPAAVQEKGSLEDYMRRVRRAVANARPEPRDGVVPSIELRNPELAAALLAVTSSPGARTHREAAAAYRKVGIHDKAFDHLSEALRFEPRDAAALDARARIWRDWGFPDRSLVDAHRAVYYAPLSAEAHNTLGTVLQALGQRKQARREYERAVRLDGNAAYARNNLCYLEFLDGRHEKAIEHCEAAVGIDPSLVAARNNLALAYAAAGRLDLARREFLAAGNDAAGQFNLGIVHLANRQYYKAAGAFKAAHTAEPSMRIAGDRERQARRLAASEGTD
jgi:tetratricopeptide (TPR) repeat protein